MTVHVSFLFVFDFTIGWISTLQTRYTQGGGLGTSRPPYNLTKTILAAIIFYDMHSNVSSCPNFFCAPPTHSDYSRHVSGGEIPPRKFQFPPGNFAKYGTPKSRPTAEKLQFVGHN